MNQGLTGQGVDPALAKSMQFHQAGEQKRQAGDNQKALMFYQAAIKTCPMNGVPYAALVKMLVELEQWRTVVEVISATPKQVYDNNSHLRFFHGIALIETDQRDKAIGVLTPLEGQPGIDNGSLFNNLGTCYNRAQDYPNARDWYLKADAAGFRDPMFFVNIAGVFNKIGDIDNASKYYRKGCDLYPDNDDLLYERAIYCLKTGDFKEGFRLYQHRFGAKVFGAKPFSMSIPQWHGEPGIDHLLVVLEQGIGDQVLYSALLREMTQKVPNLTVSADKRLLPLIQRSHPTLTVIDHGVATGAEQVKACDAFLHGADMGLYARAAIGRENRFLAPDEALASTLRQRYQEQFPGKTLVGIAWRSKREVYGEMKTVALDHWLPLLRRDDVQFISFQYGDVKAELEDIARRYNIHIHVDEQVDSFNDLEAVAAQANALDLVITTSNSNAHLAAATGANTWLIVPTGAGLLWYWGLSGNHCAWYPQVEMFRQQAIGDWQGVMADVAARFETYLEKNK